MKTEEELDRDCLFTFLILYKGWECDGKGWVMHDGSVFTTNHNHVCEMSVAEIEMKISEAEFSLAGLKYALTATKHAASL